MRTVFFALTLLCYTTYAFHHLPHRARGGVAGKLHMERQLLESSTADEKWFDQELDHNNPARGQFKQRYFIDSTYWDHNNGPVFLEINGEGPASPPGGYIRDLAKMNNALMFGLEHRFYGQSVPNKDFSVKNLQFLSTRQALADLANFITTMERGIPGSRKWVVFGGSYSGALSAWFKLKYPDLVVGAHSSSGVVNAIYNFTEFDEQVSIAVGDECADALRKTTAAFEDGVKKGQGKQLRSLFGMSETTSNGDFFYMLADSAAMGAQYGHKYDLCLAMLSGSSDPSHLIIKFANWTNDFWGKQFGGDCFYDTECLKNTPSKWQPTSRAWRWQKCSELAYFQIAPKSNSLRSTLYETPQYVTDQCVAIFGSVIKNTDATNLYYGGADIQGSNIFFSDFSDDPWQRASVVRTIKHDEPFELVTCDGCGHCQDFHSPLPSDPQPLTQERKKLADFVAKLVK